MTTKRKLLIWIPLAAILVNGVIYFIVSNVRSPPLTLVTGGAPRPPGTPPALGLTHETRGDSKDKEHLSDDKQDEQKNLDDEKTAFARRAIGLAALEAGDYEKALINFTEARALLGDKAQVGDLLRVTEELRGHPGAGPHRSKPTPAGPVTPPPSRPVIRASSPHRVATKEATAPVESSPVAEAPSTGLLIVTTTPRGLLVQVDETPIDLTPMRAKVSAGSHRVALLDGDRKVYESTFAVKEGATATVFKDLSAEVVAERKPTPAPATPYQQPPAPSSSPPTASGLAKKDEAPSPELVPAAALEAPPTRQARTSPLLGPNTGTLAISSPGLYGVVWVNGRPRGYPPVEVADMPAGPIKIEVRVNGVEKRSSTVVVQPGVTTPVTLRSRSTTP